jgi:hypothetical protein
MSTPPPNWYPDPKGEAELRYWDGSQWTEHTHSGQPQAAPAQPPPAQAPPQQAPAPQGPPAAGTPTAAGGYHQPAYQQGAAAPAAGSKRGSKLPLIIGGALAAVAVVVVLVLVLAGGGDDEGDSPEDQVKNRIEEISTGKDPEICETGYTTTFIQKATGRSGSEGVELCKQQVPQNKTTGVEINEVEVSGSRATAAIVEDGGDFDDEKLEITLVEQGGEWKVDDLDRPEVAQGDDAERAIINTVLNFGSSEGVKACDYLSYVGLQRLGGRSGCEDQFKEGQPANYSPEDVQVSGKTATMTVTETKQQKTINFKLSRELGQWKIDSFEQQ